MNIALDNKVLQRMNRYGESFAAASAAVDRGVNQLIEQLESDQNSFLHRVGESLAEEFERGGSR